MVFQNYALYPHMNVFGNMSFGLKIKKRPKEEIKGRVEEAAAILDLEEFLYRKILPALRRPAPEGGHGTRHCPQTRDFSL